MNKHAFKQPLIAVGLLALVGVVGAQTYYTHELVNRVTTNDARAPAVSAPVAASVPIPAAGRWDPWSAMHADMMRMQAQMDQMFDSAYPGMPSAGLQPGGGQVTLEEQGNDYLVTAQIPGAEEGDINVHLDGRLLSISSEIRGQEQQTADNGQVNRRESYASTFQQAFTLPGPVDAAGMHTQYQDGVLTVTIPKAAS